jgi:hypothetical protein
VKSHSCKGGGGGGEEEAGKKILIKCNVHAALPAAVKTTLIQQRVDEAKSEGDCGRKEVQ